MSNLADVIHILPPMKSGNELLSALKVMPEYDRSICNAGAAVRLMALSNLYKIYVPQKASQPLEILCLIFCEILIPVLFDGIKTAVKLKT